MSARPNKAVNLDAYSGRFAARLRELRLKRKMTVDQLAKISGIPDKTLYKWESGDHAPTIDRLPELAQALGVKPRTLLPE